MHYSNYHTHTKYCDGTENPEAYIGKAIELGMANIGFSGHAPVPFENPWSMRWDGLEKYRNEILHLKAAFHSKINVWLSMEIDYIPKISKSYRFFRERLNMDYVIGSVHLVKPSNTDELWFIDGPAEGYDKGLAELFGNNPRLAVEAYYNQIKELIHTQKFDFIAHLDKVKMNNKERLFSTSEEWYKKSVENTLNLISDKDIAVEVNTRGIYKGKCTELFPSIEILEQVYMTKIPIVLSSDAHAPEELVKHFDESVQLLKDIGFKGVFQFNGEKWEFANF